MMLDIVEGVLGAFLLILGVLVGASVHREAMRRQRRHLQAERKGLEEDRYRFDRQRGAVPGL